MADSDNLITRMAVRTGLPETTLLSVLDALLIELKREFEEAGSVSAGGAGGNFHVTMSEAASVDTSHER